MEKYPMNSVKNMHMDRDTNTGTDTYIQKGIIELKGGEIRD
jgi:hypothetical protein